MKMLFLIQKINRLEVNFFINGYNVNLDVLCKFKFFKVKINIGEYLLLDNC